MGVEVTASSPAAATTTPADRERGVSKGGSDSDESCIRKGTLRDIFSTANGLDYLYMALGTLGGCMTGVAIPLFIIFWGEAVDDINDGSNIQSKVNEVCMYFVYIAIGNVLGGFLQVYFWSLAGARQTQKLRAKYVRAILSMEIGWFDTCGAGELATKVSDLSGKIQDAIGRKFGDSIQYAVTIVASLIAGLILEWRLALVMLGCIPFIGACGAYMIMASADAQNAASTHYAAAGGLASESLGAIRTVTALNAQPDVISRYRKFLLDAMRIGITKGFKLGVGNGALFSSMMLVHALGLWYGGKLVADSIRDECTSNCVTGGKIIAVFFAILMGALALGQITPPLGALAAARSAVGPMMEVIEREPQIDGLSEEGHKPEGRMEGRIELKDVVFAYPTRPDLFVCQGYSLTVESGESLALVGASGSGKSTVVNLLLRFYDPNSGSVCLDGMDIRTLNVRWLRSTIGYVGQEPVLFSGSIYENILYGLNPSVVRALKDSNSNAKATTKNSNLMEKVRAAADLAHAHEFITEFPEQYDTEVGSSGTAMSGGQKQRIAIARALIKRPAVLLLDEATSALDSASEKIVQQSIDELQKSHMQTTIVIAHRLSTIRTCDRIAVIKNGAVAEIGKHDVLMAQQGVYANLVRLQVTGQEGIDDVGMGDPGEENKADDVSDATAPPEAETLKDGVVTKGEYAKVVAKGSDADAVEAVEAVEAEEVSKEEGKELMNRIYKLIYKYPFWFAVAMLGGGLFGGMFPIWGFMLAYIQNTYFLTDPAEIERQSAFAAYIFIMLACEVQLGGILQYFGFAQMGERISAKLRSDMFEGILRREIAFFDKDENSVGELTSRLAEDSETVNKATGLGVTKVVQCMFTIMLGAGLAFSASWKIALVTLATFPISIAMGAVQMQEMAGGVKEKNTDMGEGAIISNAFTHMRTVSAFSVQYQVTADYLKLTQESADTRCRNAIIAGLGFGSAQGAENLIYALLFYYGTTLIVAGEVNFKQFMIAVLGLMLGAFGLGAAMHDLTDQKEGIIAAKRIFRIVDEALESPIDSLSQEGERPAGHSAGRIELVNVNFAYPSRPDTLVCRDYCLTIEPGEVVALVGPSGSGKSTIMNLLLRFYDPVDGEVRLDGQDIRTMNVRWLRSQIGYVGQEPVLFQGSVASNVVKGRATFAESELLTLDEAMAAHDVEHLAARRRGRDGDAQPKTPAAADEVLNEEYVAEEDPHSARGGVDRDVVDACKESHAHEFITDFPKQYDTDVGDGSIMVSGGQKQRIAIARALIKRPSVLLLDEATSALDSASEKIVQESIDELQKTHMQTIIVIAHRLTTIKNADKIAVIDKGQVVEIGRHEELLAAEGLYARLWARQSSAVSGKGARGSLQTSKSIRALSSKDE